MKKRFLKITSLAIAAVMLSTNALFAAPVAKMEVADEDVNFNESAFEAEFADLNSLEEVVLTEGVSSFEELAALDAQVNLENVVMVNAVASTQGFSFSNFDWPSGLWGFLCCPIGFFVVITNKDKTKDQKTSFWIGFAAGVVIGALSPTYYSY